MKYSNFEQKKNADGNMKKRIFQYCILFIIFCSAQLANTVFAQQEKDSTTTITEGALNKKDSLNNEFDIGDLYNWVFRPKKQKSRDLSNSNITVVPNIMANPTLGFQGGIKAVAGRVFGKKEHPETYMSVAATSASITTKGILYFYITHNIFTPGNKWNFQGSLVASKSVLPDYGQGIGVGSADNAADEILIDRDRKAYVYHSQYYKFYEKVYKQIVQNLFMGGGLEFDIRRKLTVAGDNLDETTPQEIYNGKHGFENDHYMSNGFLFNIEYTTRDNQNRPYKGMYLNADVRENQTWLGSTKNATQLTIDFRKYFSLSVKNPEHVLAFWAWNSDVLSGALPYLELPGTTRDPLFRSGRGYTAQYFKSTQFFYSEVEYRFPITRNKFLSGVTFANVESANNDADINLFDAWQPAAGFGLRILFNKVTRTNLCLDYAWGRYGSKGFFLGLNDAF